jgi:hypothetical protein
VVNDIEHIDMLPAMSNRRRASTISPTVAPATSRSASWSMTSSTSTCFRSWTTATIPSRWIR